nr:DUF2158 domain-containing protein [Paraburkholderia sp. BL8N3]
MPRKLGKHQVSRFDLRVAAHCACLLDTDRSRSNHDSRLDWCQWFDEHGELRQDIFDLDNVRCDPRSIPAGS